MKKLKKVKEFKDLSLKAQKMKIVQDAIAQILAGIIVPIKSRSYFVINHKVKDIIYDYSKSSEVNNDLQRILEFKEKKTCIVCGKGGIFAACVLNTDKVNILYDDYNNEKFQSRKLKKWFSYLELDMIETAFEKTVIMDRTKLLTKKVRNKGSKSKYDQWRIIYLDLANKCIAFGKQFRSPKQRLLAILENILINGKFKP